MRNQTTRQKWDELKRRYWLKLELVEYCKLAKLGYDGAQFELLELIVILLDGVIDKPAYRNRARRFGLSSNLFTAFCKYEIRIHQLSQEAYCNMKAFLKYELLFSLFFLCYITAYSQKNKTVGFKDYPIVQNIDSLEQAVREKKTNPEAYLHGLITLEKNRINYLGWFGNDLNTIKVLAYKLRSPLAIASYHYFEGIYLREQSLGNASRNTLEAIRYFEATKDTLGIISCYFEMLVNTSNLNSGILIQAKTPQEYYDKIMNLGQKSKNVCVRLIQIRTIFYFEKLVKKTQDFAKGIKEVEEALALIKSEPDFLKIQIYVAISTFYSRYSKHEQALNYSSKAHELYKNLSSRFSIKFYYSFALDNFNVGAYNESEIYLIESINKMEKLKEEEKDNRILYNLYYLLSEIQYKKRDFETARATTKKAEKVLNKRYSLLKESFFYELKTQYEIQQKEFEIALLKKKNELEQIEKSNIVQNNEIVLLSQKNKLTESQSKQYEIELKNNLLEQKNQAIESRNLQYKIAMGIGSVSLIIVSTLLYLLYKTNRKLAHFTQTLSHDALGYINHILNYATLGKNADDLPEAKFASQKIYNNASNLKKMAQNLIQFNQMRKRFNLSEVPLLPLAMEVANEMGSEILENGVNLNIGELPTINTDRELVKQVLRNLMGNAVKFKRLDVPFELAISARKLPGNKWEIEVADNGCGIDAGKLPFVFDEFSKGEKSKEGSGLGLYICRQIVEGLGGAISVKSVEGVGSRFAFTLPANDRPAQTHFF